MELVSDIIRIKNINDVDNINNTRHKLRELNIRDIAIQYHNHIDFLKNVDRDKISSILTPIFDIDLTNTVIMAYYFVYYKDTVFDSFKTRSEIKLIKCAYTLVNYIDNIDDHDNHDFINQLDRFNSLYYLWVNRQNIADIDQIYQNISESINMYNYSKKYNITRKIVSKNIKKYIDNLFRINCNIAVKILISNYSILSSIPCLFKKIWKKIKYNYNINIFLILVSELKHQILIRLDDIICIKKIYYELDIEELVKQLYYHDLNVEHINKLLITISKALNVEYRFCYTEKSIIKCLKKMFENIYNHNHYHNHDDNYDNSIIVETKIIVTKSNNLICAI
jgi:hypothetical protein